MKLRRDQHEQGRFDEELESNIFAALSDDADGQHVGHRQEHRQGGAETTP
jgi:hypothetical protein